MDNNDDNNRRTSPRLSSKRNSNKPQQQQIELFAEKSPSPPTALATTTNVVVVADDDEDDKEEDLLKVLGDWVSHKDVEYHHFQPEEATKIRQALLDWYRVHRRKLPWRGDPPPYDGSTSSSNNNKTLPSSSSSTNSTTTPVHNNSNNHHYNITPYGIWISEIMCQQTRVAAVIPYWLKWMESFPTVQHLANATEEQVNSHWAGLGFYRRARLLHNASKYLVEQHGGELPCTIDELMKIPGVGKYTACAIGSIAFGIRVPVVDGNVCRLLSRLCGIAQHIKAPIFKDKLGWELAQQIVNGGASGDDDGSINPGDVNQAMMELGATYCSPSGTGIDDNDPLKGYYLSTKIGTAYHKYYNSLQQKQQSKVMPSTKKLHNLIQKAKSNHHPASSSSSSSSKKKTSSSSPSSCSICQSGGISLVLQQLEEGMIMENNNSKEAEDNNVYRAAQCLGHTIFPLAPPKQSKREEVLAVAALSLLFVKEEEEDEEQEQEDETYWLLVRRPKKGLLASQWEFPSTCVWNSDTSNNNNNNNANNMAGKKRKSPSSSNSGSKKTGGDDEGTVTVPTIPSARVRQEAVKMLLDDILSQQDGESQKIINNNNNKEKMPSSLKNLKGPPLEHIFSHVRHTYAIQYGSITTTATTTRKEQLLSWTSATGREVRWMRQSDMKEAGITSGVLKILKAVQQEEQKNKKRQGFFQPKKKKKKQR